MNIDEVIRNRERTQQMLNQAISGPAVGREQRGDAFPSRAPANGPTSSSPGEVVRGVVISETISAGVVHNGFTSAAPVGAAQNHEDEFESFPPPPHRLWTLPCSRPLRR